MTSILAATVGLDSVYVGLVEQVNRTHRIVAWQHEQRDENVRAARQVASLTQTLGEQIGRTLWDVERDAPFCQSEQPVRHPPLDHVAISISPRPLLRVWLFGLSSGLSIGAAHRAMRKSPATVVGTTTLADGESPADLAHRMQTAQTDVAIICGGYDIFENEKSGESANNGGLLSLCQHVGQTIERMAIGQRPVVLYAASHLAADAARSVLQESAGRIEIEKVDNVMPTPERAHTVSLAHALEYRYWRLARRAPGFSQLERWVTSPIQLATQETVFAQFVRAWQALHGLPHLHGIYATKGWRLHVLAQAATPAIRMRYVTLESGQPPAEEWPPAQLVSGRWPAELARLGRETWWDRNGILPAIAPIGQFSPQTMLQLVNQDLFDA